jgi:CDP-diglyceride synthetase
MIFTNRIIQEAGMPMPVVHDRLANTILLFCVAMALWGGWRFIRRQGVSSSYWGALVIAEVLILLQGALGAYLYLSGLRPMRGIHILYGVVSALALPLVYFYTKGREERPEMLLYSVSCLILIGLVLRAMFTGGQ